MKRLEPPGSGAEDLCLILKDQPDLTDTPDLTALVAPEAEALGFDLVRVKLFGGKGDLTLQVMAERPDTRQLTIDDCAELSRRISDVLDALELEGKDPIQDEYRLEVSSPGIDRPLTRLKDFSDWAGHEARIVLLAPIEGRKVLTGTLKGVTDDRIAIYLAKHGELDVPFAQVNTAKLVLTDALIAATRPLSMDGADEEEIEHDDEAVDAPEGADREEGHN
ncbi:ribosome maturation protein RimP [Sphingomonas sp. PAMC 26621]|uniref:ribosome maturation protein RimP n=1 Tax=Sphingomonas sp. PAMC 26621 TaxID=1112213 RepID=UPI0002884F08|nr:ribosome maturation protein RimP [Sphingomonas sp. PAMC 26621]